MNDLNFTFKDCDDVIRQCLQISDIQTIDFEIIPRHKDNFIFKITGEYKSKKETLYLYGKSKSRPPHIDKIFYEDFKNVLEVFNPKITPKFYCGKSELLFFEDLTCQKFQTNANLFDLKHLNQVLNVLAQFHAAGFAYEEAKSKKLNEEYELQTFNFDLKEAEDLLWSCVDNRENVDEVVRKLEERQVSSKFAKTLCHGNLTSPNILFYYNNGAPNECKLVNFKSKLYAPPVYDVLQVIFFNTSEKFRQENFDDLLTFYYNQLREEMEKYHLNVDDFLSNEHFRMASHYILPLIKLETAILQKKNRGRNDKTIQELKEILSFPSLSREDCYVVVKNAITSLDYELLTFFENSRDRHANSLKLTIKIRHFLEEKTINCFVKYLSKETNKEIFLHKILLPQFRQHGITSINCCLPLSHFQRSQDVMVFEDLSILNFRSLSKMNFADFSLLSIIIKKLAKLHSCSLIFEEKVSEKLKTTHQVIHNYGLVLTETLFPKDGIFCEKLRNLIFEIANLFPELKTKSEENLKNCVAKLLKSGDDRFKNVICHGDIRTKNILVQFDDDVPIDSRFINFHSIKYCPPAYDFLCTIYLTTNRETRIKNEEALKHIYYQELEKTVSVYNYQRNKFFSYQEFIDSVEALKPQVIVQAIMYEIAAVCVPQKNSSTLTIDEACKWVLSEDSNEYLSKMCEKEVIFKEKLRDNVVDLYEICNSVLPTF